MIVAIYNLSDGSINRVTTCTPDVAADQCQEGEELYLNYVAGHTHVIDGDLCTKEPPARPEVELLQHLRHRRNWALSECDWTQMPDSPLPADKKAAWSVYRQALRDFPANCDPANPAWPESP